MHIFLEICGIIFLIIIFIGFVFGNDTSYLSRPSDDKYAL